MTAIAFPFHRIHPDDVIAEPWRLVEEDEPTDLGYYLPSWDYSSDLRVKRRLRVNIARVAGSLGLPTEELRLTAVLTLGTGGSREARRRWIPWSDTMRDGVSDLEIDVPVDGIRLSQHLTLRTELLLKGPLEAGGPLSPKRAGTRLWEDTHFLRLEPEEIRFPIETASFRTQFPDSRGALWKLEWSAADLSQEFIGAFRLFINADEPDFVVRVSNADAMTIRLLMGAVRLQITRGALANETFDQHLVAANPTSIAGAVGAWLQLAFPNQDLKSIRQAAAVDPSSFEAALAAVGDEVEEDHP